MRSTLIYLLLATSICFVSCNSKENTPQTIVEKNGKLSVKGTSLVNEKGEPVLFKGVSYGWHNAHPRFYNAGSVATFAHEWKCDMVRASVGIELKESYIDNPEAGIKCATAVIDAAIANGIYVILDWHSHTIRLSEAKEFFHFMATKYKGVPNIIYEIFNEPVDDSWEAVKAYSIEVIRTIRAIEPDNIILVGTPHWDQDIHLAADDPITGFENLMYTLHFYAATHKAELIERGNYALSKGLPLFVSECAAMEASGDGPIDYESWNTWTNWMTQNSISWAMWSVSDKDETCSMIEPTASSEGPWKENELREWGNLARTTLTK